MVRALEPWRYPNVPEEEPALAAESQAGAGRFECQTEELRFHLLVAELTVRLELEVRLARKDLSPSPAHRLLEVLGLID